MTLTVVGLSLDIVGVAILFLFAPEKFVEPQSRAFFSVEGESKKAQERWVKRQPVRKNLASVGVGLIILGFLFQIAGEVCH